ncbi:MAG: PxKF domain-containing protein [Anaerolineales bacterium]
MNKVRMISVLMILAVIFSFANVSPAAAQDPTPPLPSQGAAPQDLPGSTQGTGIHFALPDSPYLPVTLDSSVPVTLTLSSVPDMVDLTIAPEAAAGSAEFTLSGFAANTLYYHYADEGLNPVTFTTDATGSFTYTQDLSESHRVWFRDQPSTYYLYDNATGGDCSTSLGTWSSTTKTCTLTGNVNDAIFIQNDGITLDGAGYQISASGNYAVYSYGFNGVTIKNLDVSVSTYGIQVGYGNNITVTNNTVSGSGGVYYPIYAYGVSNLSITDNTITDFLYYGIYSDNSCYYSLCGNVTIDQNTISSSSTSGYYGILTYEFDDNGSTVDVITNNTISNLYYGGILTQYDNNNTISDNTISNILYGPGIYMFAGSNNAIQGNTISNSSGGVQIDGYFYSQDYWYYGTHYVSSQDYSSTNNTVYQNNFVNTSTPIHLANWGYTYNFDYRPGTDYYGSYTYDTDVNVGNVFNLAAPDGGNYYSQYDESTEGCNNTNSDTFCDSPFIGSGGAVDNLPWTTEVGSNQPPTAGAGGPYLGDEGAAIAMSSAGASDPDVADILTYSWSVDSALCSFDSASTLQPNLTCTDNGSYTATLEVSDGVNPPVTSAAAVTVDNVAPNVDAPAATPEPSTEGQSVTASAAFGDPGSNDGPFTCTVNYGDGSGDLPGTVLGNTCTGPAHVYATFGLYSVVVNVTDKDNDTGSNAANHVVIFNWAGFFQPVDNLPTWNSVNAGRAIPVKFSLGGDQGLNIFAAGYPRSEQIACNSTDLVDGIEETVTPGSSALTYDPGSDQYHYVWKTEKSWAGTCRQLVVKLADGTIQRANFQFK